MKFTILGANGFIGSNLAKHLLANGHEVVFAQREVKQLEGQNLGHVIYAIGLTGDFRTRPHDTIEAHVTLLSWVIKNCSFESFLYCSSTRVYGGLPANELVNEESKLVIIPNHDSLYDLSKLLGESLCLSIYNPAIRVVRLSNVYGIGQSKDTFLGAVLNEAQTTGAVVINDNPESAKDYISIEDVVALMEQIILQGKHRIYNLASGKSVKGSDIAAWLTNLKFKVSFLEAKNIRKFPLLDINRVAQEFSFKPKGLEEDIKMLVNKEAQ